MTASATDRAPSARRVAPLTAEETVEGARQLLRTEGVEGFSMRKLASRLGVSPMTIYLRFDNKDALLRAVGRQSLADIEPPDRHGDPAEQLLELLRTLRARLLDDQVAMLVLGDADTWPLTALAVADHGLWLMEQIGYEGPDAVEAFRAVFWHAIASALADHAIRAVTPHTTADALDALDPEMVPTYRALRRHFTPFDPEALFELTSRRLIEGLVAAAPH